MSLLKRTVNYVEKYGVLDAAKRAFAMLYRRTAGEIKRKRIFYKDNLIHMAFYPTGGLGDYIISKAVLEEISSCSKCAVTIYCDKAKFAHAIFRDITEDIWDYRDFDIDLYKYDLAIKAEHFIHVEVYKKEKIYKYAPELWEKICYILDNQKQLYVNIEQQCYRERIQFERCRVNGLDRWTEQRMGEAFKIANHHVNVPLDVAEENRWINELGATKYVTLNYGADEMIPGKSQLKLWAGDNYEEFVGLIKEKLLDITVVQLGDSNAPRIKGIDRYIFGESLEYVKYVLKGSMCHIDCEGGLVHLATQLGTKCIVMFGPTPVHMYGYEQNINIVSEVCSNCMGLHDMWAYDCYMGYEGASCMKSITARKVFDELVKVISV